MDEEEALHPPLTSEKRHYRNPDRAAATVSWPKPQGAGRAGGMPGNARRDHQAERLQAIRLRYSINIHLKDSGLVAPAAIGAITVLPAAEAVRLLARRQWRVGDVAALQAVAVCLGLEVALLVLAPALGLGWAR